MDTANLRKKFIGKLRGLWLYLRTFDYTDLRFLYVACLLTIAFVYTVFRVSQFYLNQQESRALATIQNIDGLRDNVTELERLIAFAQNRTATQYGEISKALVRNYGEITRDHRSISTSVGTLRRRCEGRPCADVFNPEYFTIAPEKVAKDLANEGLSLKAHNALLKQLFDKTSRYHTALKDTLELSFQIIHSRNRTTLIFDVIGYFALIFLLVLQAVYIFRPAIHRLNASLATRSDFLSRISHEIRNPMNSIIGMADILKGTRLNYEQSQYVNNLIRSGHALLDMLNNLIDFSMVEGRKLSLNLVPFDLFRSVDNCLNLIAIQAHHKNLGVYFSMDPGIRNLLIGDSMRLEQVLINLLNNAVKFTELGRISLSVDLVRETEQTVDLKFSVEDSGIGIKQELLGEIFESFVQADSSIQRKYGGSGLGLSISSEIIKMMGARLEVASTFGQGSCFFFTISLKKQAVRKEFQAPPLEQLRQSRFVFLVAPQESEPYRRTFTRSGSKVAILHTASELKALFGASGLAGGDVEILIDDSVGIISMINCRNLAEEYGLAERAVALISSNFTKENMDLLKRNGFRRFLIKPLKPWELLSLPPEVYEENYHSAPGANGGSGLVNKIKAKDLKILLVDDSNDNLFLLKEVVGPLASSVHFAENGLEALEKFRANSYDVVFMDIQMPVMDGYTAIRKIRQIEMGSGRTVPVFAVTAHAGLVDAQRCREAGFTDRIVKPVVRSDIYKSLSKAFSIETAEIEPNPQHTVLPAKYLAKLIPAYLKTRFEDVEKLKRAIQDEDFQMLSQLGHKIKGSAGSYGFARVSELSRRLETEAHASNIEECRHIVDQLESEFVQENERIQKPDLLF